MRLQLEKPESDVGQGDRALVEELRDRAWQEVYAGRLEEALGLLDEAVATAQRSGEPDLVDLAFCNRSSVAITLGRYDGVPELREILMRNRDPEICFAAAYHLCGTYWFKKESKKALFYGQIARDRALATGKQEFIAKAHNMIGLCLVAESYFEEGIREYERALALLPEELSVLRAAILVNLAYPKAVLGEYTECFDLLFTCLRWYRRTGKLLYESWPHLVLCYTYIEIGRFDHAWRHGKRALDMAEKAKDHEAIKNALFLLGEVEKSVGDIDTAYDYYARLQREFCPEVANLPEMMLVVESKQLVNLRA